MIKAIREKLARLARNRKTVRFGLFALAGLAVLALPAFAYADVVGEILGAFAKLFEWLTQLVGYILFQEVRALIAVAAYSDFVAPGPTAVQVGWIVARDLANMFFILILLIIAFGTILGIENYNMKRLPLLLIMAVVINFSKTITGILIDFGQVIMLTFVNGFKDAAGGNFLNAFQVNKLLQLSADGQIEESGLLLGMMLAFIMVSVAAVTVLIMLVTLLFRIVLLWFLIILSPIAFLAKAVPGGEVHFNNWWNELKGNIVYGPTVAFFLWLALLTAQVSDGNLAGGAADGGGGKFDLQRSGATKLETEQASGGIPTDAAKSDVYLSMIIFVAMLFAGLKFATEAKGALGKTSGIGRKYLNKGARMLGRPAMKGAKGIGKFAGRQALKPVRSLTGDAMSGVGKGLSYITGGRVGTGLAVQGGRMRAKRAAEKQERREKLFGTSEELGKVSASAQARRYTADMKRANKLGDTRKVKSLADGMMADQQLLKAVKADKKASAITTKLLDEGRGKDAALTKTHYDWQAKDWQNQTEVGTKERTNAVRKSEVEYMSSKDRLQAAPDLAPSQFKQMLEGNKDDKKDVQSILLAAADKESRAKMLGFDVNTGSKEDHDRIMDLSPQEAVSEYLNKMRVSSTDISPDLLKNMLSEDVTAVTPEAMLPNRILSDYVYQDVKRSKSARADAGRSASKMSAIQGSAGRELAAARSSGDEAKIASAMIDALNVGRDNEFRGMDSDGNHLDQSDILRALGKHMNPSKLRSSIDDNSTPEKIRNAKAAMATLAVSNSDKFRRLKGGGLYEQIIPSQDQIDAMARQMGVAISKEVEKGVQEGASKGAEGGKTKSRKKSGRSYLDKL